MQRAMKRVLIVVGIVLIVVIILHVALFAFINTKGKDLIITGLKDNLGLEATMDSLSLKFPFNLEVKNFKCEVLSFKRGNIFLGFFNPFTHKISLNKIYLDGLDVKVDKDKSEMLMSQFSKNSSKTEEKVVVSQNSLDSNSSSIKNQPEVVKKSGLAEKNKPNSEEKGFSFAVGNFYLKNSSIEVNYPIDNKPFNIIFSNIFLKVKGFAYPDLSKFYVRLDANLVSPLQESQKTNTLDIKGWIDYNNKNMDLAVKIDEFDYVAFGKFYPSFWRANNLRLGEAVLSFESNFKSKDNELVIDNFLTIETIKFIEEEGERESFQANTLKTIIAFLKGDKPKPILHFKLMTNMDSPKIDFSSLKSRLMEVAGFGPVAIIEGAVSEVKDKIGNLGDATVGSVIENLKGAAGILDNILKIDNTEQSQESKEDTSLGEQFP